MDSPVTRLAGACIVLAIFYVVLFRGVILPAAAGDVTPEDDLRKSRDAFAAERYEEALEPTRRITAVTPTQHVYLDRLARIYRQLGRPRDEAASWEAFMRTSPTPIDACPDIGDAYKRAGDAVASALAFDRCRALRPDDPDMAFFSGRAEERLQRPEEARARYRDALRIAPGYADALLALGRMDLWDRHVKRAQAAAVNVLARYPRHADALLLAGLTAQREGDAAAARRYLEEALAVSETYVDVHLALGILDFSQSQIAAARAHFERAAALDPSRQNEIAVWLERTRMRP